MYLSVVMQLTLRIDVDDSHSLWVLSTYSGRPPLVAGQETFAESSMNKLHWEALPDFDWLDS